MYCSGPIFMLFLIHYRGCWSYMYVYSAEGKPQCFWSSQETRLWCVTFVQYLILGLSIDWFKSKNIKKLRLLVSAKVKNPHLTLLTRWLTGLGERVGLTADLITSKYPPPFQNWNFSVGELWKIFRHQIWSHYCPPPPRHTQNPGLKFLMESFDIAETSLSPEGTSLIYFGLNYRWLLVKERNCSIFLDYFFRDGWTILMRCYLVNYK